MHIIGGKRQRRCKTRLNASRLDVKHAENAKFVLEYREVHLQSVLQAISSRRSSNSIEEGCWCLQYTLTSCSPPVSSMLTTTTTTTQAKSWRSDTLIILPGWECHTGGSRSKPTVHRCSQSGRRLWVARQVHNHEPNGSAIVQQYQVPQCQHGSGAVQIHSTLSQIHSTLE